MNDHLKSVALALVCLILAASVAIWWNTALERRWKAKPYVSEAARENRMLGASLLLRDAGHPVTLAGSINDLALGQLPDGTLIVGDAAGVVAPDKARQLLDWVRRGNTLVAQPRWLNSAEVAQLAAGDTDASEAEAQADSEESAAAGEDASTTDAEPEAQERSAPVQLSSSVEEDEEEEEEEDEDAHASGAASEARAGSADLVEADPVAAYLGVRLGSETRLPPCPKAAPGVSTSHGTKPACDNSAAARRRVTPLTLPGAPYALELSPGGNKLVSLPEARAPAWNDPEGTALRVYDEGRGRIVMVAADYFNNTQLKRFDHAELLLAISKLHRHAGQVTIVKNLDMPRWYRALWDRYQLALLALGLTLALLLWKTVRRFGPLLPEPQRERRSLLEHIDASGAWLWNAEDGRTLLLESARSTTVALLRRRAPGVLRRSRGECSAALASATGLPETDIDQALYSDALGDASYFTRQIRTLQTLRNHYER